MITRSISDSSRTIRVPVHMNERLSKIKNAERQLTVELGRKPTSSELAEATGIPEAKIKETYKIGDVAISLDTPAGEGEDTHIGDFIPDSDTKTPEQHTEEVMLRKYLEEVIGELEEREQMVLRMRFGFDGNEPMTLEEVGKKFHVTRERIRQIENKAIHKIKTNRRKMSKLSDYI